MFTSKTQTNLLARSLNEFNFITWFVQQMNITQEKGIKGEVSNI